jgi:hypothetical protein
MFKTIQNKIWAFDCEWVPDPATGRAVYKLPETTTVREVVQKMWNEGGATADNPMPYLKTALCRVVSIATVTRSVANGVVSLRLLSLPRDATDKDQCSERVLLDTFLNAIGQHRPQLIGYNSHTSDLKILIQRALVNGVQAKLFCQRPDKPWEGIDYFARGSEHNIDLLDIVGGWGKTSPSLHEIATAAGIPGKISLDGNQVAELWLQEKLSEIVAYNEFDAITTFLLWLRIAHFAGLLSSQQFMEEQRMMKALLREEAETKNKSHLLTYLAEWQEIERLTPISQFNTL